MNKEGFSIHISIYGSLLFLTSGILPLIFNPWISFFIFYFYLSSNSQFKLSTINLTILTWNYGHNKFMDYIFILSTRSSMNMFNNFVHLRNIIQNSPDLQVKSRLTQSTANTLGTSIFSTCDSNSQMITTMYFQ